MNNLKTLGSVLLGILFFVGLLVAFGLLLAFGSRIALVLEPIVSWVAAVALILNIFIVLPLTLIPATRAFGSMTMYISSYIFGLATWLFGFAVTYMFLGIGWLIIGVLLAGIGVVPLGIIGAALHGQWQFVVGLVLNLMITFGLRYLSMWGLGHVPEKREAQDVRPKNKVLLVYSNEAVSAVIMAKLKAAGYEARAVDNGEDALAASLSFQPDVMITDIMLSKVSGYDVIDILKKTPETRSIPIIVLSGLTRKDDVERAKKLGAAEYLFRNETKTADLLQAVERQIGK